MIIDPRRKIDAVRTEIRSIWSQHWERLMHMKKDDLEGSEFEKISKHNV